MSKELTISTDVPLIAVNSTGGITLSPLATKENLTFYILKHQEEMHTYGYADWAGNTFLGAIVVAVIFFLGRFSR